MLTVKHITKVDESVREATAVWLVRMEGDQACHVVSTMGGTYKIVHESGVVYVMNDNGTTVAKYDLDAYAASASES